jgi:hypothetical protein
MQLRGQNLTLEPKKNGIVITLTTEGREALVDRPDQPDFATFYDLFEDLAGNGWSTPSAAEVGGLTGCELFIQWEDDIYWHERYQVEDAIEKLLEGELFLLKA